MGRLHETGKGNGVESEPYRWTFALQSLVLATTAIGTIRLLPESQFRFRALSQRDDDLHHE
jgi:hypothetical protein